MIRDLRFQEVGYLLSRDFLRVYGALTPKQQSLALSFVDSSINCSSVALSIEDIFKKLNTGGSLRTLRRDLKTLWLCGILEEVTLPNKKNKPVLAYYVSSEVVMLLKKPNETAFVDKVKHEKEKAEIQEFKENTCGTWSVDRPGSYANNKRIIGK